MARSLRKTIGILKDKATIGLAKIAGTSVSDLDVAILKATSHDEKLIDEKYVQKILQLTFISVGYANACVQALGKRISKTRNWIVVIKVLALIHRLLREGTSVFEDELTTVSRRILYLSDFRDDAHSNAWDYSAFVRTYASYLDARLDCFLFASEPRIIRSHKSEFLYDQKHSLNDYRGNGSDADTLRLTSSIKQSKKVFVKEMEPDMLIEKLPNLQNMLEKVLACRPTGAAKHHRLVQLALFTVVKDSFQIYLDFHYGMTALLNVYFHMKQEDCIKTLEIYARSAKQIEALATFYNVSRGIGICSPAEYPRVEKVSQGHLDSLESFLRDRYRSSRQPQCGKSMATARIDLQLNNSGQTPSLLPRSPQPTRRLQQNNSDKVLLHQSKSPEPERITRQENSFERVPRRNLPTASEQLRFWQLSLAEPLTPSSAETKLVYQKNESMHEGMKALASPTPKNWPQAFSQHSLIEMHEAKTTFRKQQLSPDGALQQQTAPIEKKPDIRSDRERNSAQSVPNSDSKKNKKIANDLKQVTFTKEKDNCGREAGSAVEELTKLSLDVATPEGARTIFSPRRIRSTWETFEADIGRQDFQKIEAISKASQAWPDTGKAKDRQVGWEVAILSETSKPPNAGGRSLVGNIDRLLLENMYDQAASQKHAVYQLSDSTRAPSRSSSLALPLPAPVSAVVEDPFAASLRVPPPAYVQMADLQKKERVLLQEQQLWQQYQQNGIMSGNYGLMKFYNPQHAVSSASSQAIYRIPQPSMAGVANTYSY